MKRQILLILVLTLIGLASCNKQKIKKNTPECVKNRIKDFDQTQTCDDGVNVKKYTFQGQTVYVFDPGTCGADMMSSVIDAECNSLGFLGGITGNTEINGEDFSNATFVSTTWKR